jgi:hypothetical protein
VPAQLPLLQPNLVAARFDSDGNLVWRRVGGPGFGSAQDVAVAADGSLHITGNVLTEPSGADASVWNVLANGKGHDAAVWGGGDPFEGDRGPRRVCRLMGLIVGGWQINNILSFYSGTPFSVTASGTSLNAPENDQRADQVVEDVEILGGIGPNNAYFDPLAFKPVTEARFGTASFNSMRGPGVAAWDLGIFRRFDLTRGVNLEIRMEAFNVTNRPRFNNPGANVSNLRLNPDGSVNNLNGYAVITGTGDGSERQIRFGARLGW